MRRSTIGILNLFSFALNFSGAVLGAIVGNPGIVGLGLVIMAFNYYNLKTYFFDPFDKLENDEEKL